MGTSTGPNINADDSLQKRQCQYLMRELAQLFDPAVVETIKRLKTNVDDPDNTVYIHFNICGKATKVFLTSGLEGEIQNVDECDDYDDDLTLATVTRDGEIIISDDFTKTFEHNADTVREIISHMVRAIV